MREIKFRAWDGLNKVTKYYTLKQLAEYDTFGVDTEFEAIQSGFDNWEWMEYTGLKDKNRKEIYEGDIIEGKEGVFTIENWGDGVYRVVSSGMTWDWLHQLNSKGYLENGKGNYEIIGNIYENAELIK